MSRHFFCLVTAVTTAPFVPGHDGFVFDDLLLPFYDELIEELKRRRLTASRYKAKNGSAGLFQFSDNAGREEVF